MAINLLPLFYRYVDFTSLYPWCNKNTYNVVGHPQIITENFADVSTYFGLIKCTVLPPRGLLHPVLPYRTKDKLMFPLCKTCADTLNQNPCTHTDEERAILGTWCHVELMKAIEKGYEVLEIHEVWHWEEITDELFKHYVDTFLKIKQEANGYPKHCVTDEQKQRYIDESSVIGGVQYPFHAASTRRAKNTRHAWKVYHFYAFPTPLNACTLHERIHA